jgi:hypothetical protein
VLHGVGYKPRLTLDAKSDLKICNVVINIVALQEPKNDVLPLVIDRNEYSAGAAENEKSLIL